MASIPIRLSAALAQRARSAAAVQERSITEQVEHWARLGELVEAAVSAPSVRKLKQASHDEQLRARLAEADSASGRKKTARLIRRHGEELYGTLPGRPSAVVRIEADGKRTLGRVVNGKFVASSRRR